MCIVYDWTPTGVTNFVMLAGSSTEITDFDGWMFRNWWYELSRQRGWQSGSSSGSSGSSSGSGNTTPSKPSNPPKPQPTKASNPKPSKPQPTKAAAPAAPTSAGSQSGATASAYGQCGGGSYAGPTKCPSGYKCQKHNEWYSQCVSA